MLCDSVCIAEDVHREAHTSYVLYANVSACHYGRVGPEVEGLKLSVSFHTCRCTYVCGAIRENGFHE